MGILEYFESDDDDDNNGAQFEFNNNASPPTKFKFSNSKFNENNLDIEVNDRLGIVNEIDEFQVLVEDTFGSRGIVPARILKDDDTLTTFSALEPIVDQKSVTGLTKAEIPNVPVPVPPKVPTQEDLSRSKSTTISSAETTIQVQAQGKNKSIESRPPNINGPPAVHPTMKLVCQLKAIKDFKNPEITIYKDTLINIYDQNGKWWKCSGSVIGIGFAPSHIFEQPQPIKNNKKLAKNDSKADAISL